MCSYDLISSPPLMDREPDLGVKGRRGGMEQAAGTMVSDNGPRI